MRRIQFKRGDRITFKKSLKTGETIKGKVTALEERHGYLTVKWEGGNISHVNPISRCILTVNGEPV
jgi:hypothetical protein